MDNVEKHNFVLHKRYVTELCALLINYLFQTTSLE
jgi:hypothetical protein